MDFCDVTVYGEKFFWFCSDGVSMSRLDRFLISEGLISWWNVLGQWIGNRDISDHCSIWLLCWCKDWGSKHFCFINGWLEKSDFIPFVKNCWAWFDVQGNKAFIVKEKFQRLIAVAYFE